jgi:pimeloyl-ACP methyl ester carboxylesterase
LLSDRAIKRSIKADQYEHPVIEAGEGSLVVCLHGFPDNYETFQHQIGPVVEAGYRIVCPMLPGLTPGVQHPSGRTSPVFACDVLISFIEELQREHGQTKCHLVGHDWGGAVAYLIAGTRPDLLKSLTTICLPYNISLLRTLLRCPGYTINAWYMTFFQFWWLAEYFIGRNDFRFIDMLYRTWCPPWKDYDDRVTSVKKTLAEPGALRGALGYYRNSIFGLNAESFKFRSMFRSDIEVPTLALRGEYDQCIPDIAWEQISVRRFRDGLSLQMVENTSHFPQLENPDRVNQLLVSWLDEHDDRDSGQHR